MSWRPVSGRRRSVPARLLLSSLLGLAIASAHAREGGRPLFESEATLPLTLEAPWSQLVKNKEARQRFPATVLHADAGGRTVRLQATVEPRGLTRLRMCRFPPLRLRLGGAIAAEDPFAGQRSLKMVTHCRPGAAHEQYYFQELLAYRLYNLATGLSFRVRPLSVTYRDSATGHEDGPRFAFLIEDLRDLAKRNGRVPSPRPEFAPGDFDPEQMTRFMLFQYLIGNTDFDVLSGPRSDACCHNVRVIGHAQGGGLVAVPYDLDSAGMIDAGYAAPHHRLPITSVRQRLFRGFCVHNDLLEPVRTEFLDRRDAILGLVRTDARMSPARRRDTLDYFHEFFDILASDTRFAREIRGKCRK